MVCNNCGREVSDQAQYCDYCGSEIQPLPEPQPRKVVLSKGGNKKARAFWSTLIPIFVAVLIKTLITEACSPKAVTDTSLTGACIYGALYEDGYLTYGATRVYMPNCFVLTDDEAEEDYLFSLENGSILTVSKTMDSKTMSYNSTTASGMLKQCKEDFPDATMSSFKKDIVDGYPVIRYVVHGTMDGMEIYMGEMIIVPGKTTKEAMHIVIIAEAESHIQQVFDTLEISASFAPSYADTLTKGTGRITEK